MIDPITTGNGKHISFGTCPLYWIFIFLQQFPAWYFSSCWVHLEACKVTMSITGIKITLPLALFPAWMSFICECNPDTEMVEARKNKNHWERKVLRKSQVWRRTVLVILLQKYLLEHLDNCQNIYIYIYLWGPSRHWLMSMSDYLRFSF